MKPIVVLLRGVNVGGKTKVPMPKLKSLLEGLGFEQVVTYIQSGNVVLTTKGGGAKDVARRIERAIADTFSVDARVLIRTPAELQRIADRNPFLGDESDLTKLHVVFLRDAPAKGKGARLDPERSPPDRFHLRGRELYLHLPNGAGRSKLTIDYFERVLRVDATARNWKTLLKLVELAASEPGPREAG
jgi:uncharacterized protein (DUF1697 family)